MSKRALVRRRDMPLVARKQPLGILPTPSFWLDREVLRLALPFRLVIAATVVGVMYGATLLIPALWSAPLWVIFAAGFSMAMLLLGGLERYIRRRARQRALSR